MRRRNFIALLSGAAVWPLAAHAQQPKVKTIGVLVLSSPGSERFWQLFPKALSDLGYIEGENIHFEFRSDQGQMSRLQELAAELVRLKVDVIVPWLTPAALAAKQATREIPIVCALCGDMVGTALVEGLARPGGNVTGSSSLGPEVSAKLVELLRDTVPSVHRKIAVLINSPDPFSGPFLKQIQSAGGVAGTAIDPIMIHSAEELEAAFPAMERSRPDGVIVQGSLSTKRVAELALGSRIPAVSPLPEFVNAGGLMGYFAVEADMYHRAAFLVDKVLKGAKPAELPVEQASRFGLIINLKTARTLGIEIPPPLLGRADEVIE